MQITLFKPPLLSGGLVCVVIEAKPIVRLR